MNEDDFKPCPSAADPLIWAISTGVVLLPCGLPREHDGAHRFEMEWHDEDSHLAAAVSSVSEGERTSE